MKFNFKFMYVCIALLLVATSCSEENLTEDANYELQEDFATQEQEMLTLEQIADNEFDLTEGRTIDADAHRLPDCATKTWQRIDEHTKQLTIDFGDTPCLGNDGLYRRGIVMITFAGPKNTVGASRTTKFNNYFVMNIEFNGSKLIEFQGNHVYNRTVDMSKSKGDKTSTWTAEQVVEKIAGYNTEIKNDDIFQVTGQGSGVLYNGMSYTAEIQEPLLRKVQPGCHKNFVDGTVLFVNSDEVETLLNYDPIGGAPCDKLASLTRFGVTKFITLQ